jgi:propionyl-CoA carboxylase alpha chain/3-methylcrotonyl-CoA carboxylase alpha subunit/acetyl-CoA/propionyl-CoA carboxylase biotin carboxyl carrier protein
MLRAPSGPGVRFDSGLSPGQQVTTAFDSMLAKLIVHGPERAVAILRMRDALRNLVLLGVEHNGAYLERVLGNPAFVAGDLHTHFLEQHKEAVALPPPSGDALAALLAAASLVDKSSVADIPEPYATIGEWRN